MRSTPAIGVDALEQLDEGRDPAGVGVVAPAIAGHDLPEERDLPGAPLRELLAFAHDVVHRARPLVAPRRRDDAERAVHVAPLLDRHERAHLPFRPVHVVADRVLRTASSAPCRRSPRRPGRPPRGPRGGCRGSREPCGISGCRRSGPRRAAGRAGSRPGSAPCSPGCPGRSRGRASSWRRSSPPCRSPSARRRRVRCRCSEGARRTRPRSPRCGSPGREASPRRPRCRARSSGIRRSLCGPGSSAEGDLGSLRENPGQTGTARLRRRGGPGRRHFPRFSGAFCVNSVRHAPLRSFARRTWTHPTPTTEIQIPPPRSPGTEPHLRRRPTIRPWPSVPAWTPRASGSTRRTSRGPSRSTTRCSRARGTAPTCW